MTLQNQTKMMLNGQTILVTGGTGSFGQKFAEIVLREYSPHAIRIYSRGEFLQSEMTQRFKDDRLRFFIGDVRNATRLRRAMEGADIVIHAAALKQVPTAEYNPIEAVYTNIDGTINVIDAALDTGVKKVIAIQTDKNCYPVNMYGATKLVAEKLLIQANIYAGPRETRFSCVRYGNVLGSRGSVVPLFQKQREEGKVTITDAEMTRFWWTLEQGVRFTVSCLEQMRGGEIFVPKIPSMKVVDVAEVIAPGVPQEIVGLRAGEKLHEMLISEEESAHTRDFYDYFVIIPDFLFWKEAGYQYGDARGYTPMTRGSYTSNGNTRWLTKHGLREILDS